MASKRTFDDNSSAKDIHVPNPSTCTKRIKHGNQEEEETQHYPLFPTTMSRSATNHNNSKMIAFCFEPLIRKVMLEVIPPILDRYLAPSGGLTLNRWVNPSGTRGLQLVFKNNLPQRNYTDSKIKAEGGEPLRIELHDAGNQHIVRDVGSSMKIQIYVLHGDFGKEDWTAEEFDKQIVVPRKGKGPLLKENRVITLKDGVAFLNSVEFTDISKGRTKEFRLGAKIVRSNSIGSDIREGRSEPFRVLDVRGKSYKKHDRPLMNDEVWRLKGIGKNGKLHKELVSHGIKSVKDFLHLYKTNEASLREKIGNIADKSWNKIIAHVKEFDVDDDDDDDDDERVKQNAYKNLNVLKPLPIDTTKHGLVETSAGLQTAQCGGQDQTLQQFDFSIDQQDLLNTDPTSYNSLQPFGEMTPYSFGEGNIFSGFDGVSQTGQFDRSYSWSSNELNAIFNGTDGAGPSNHSSSPSIAVHTSSKVKLKKDWQTIRFAFKWFMLYVDVTRKREPVLFLYTNTP